MSLEKRHSAEKPQVNSLIEDLYDVIKQAVQHTIKAEIAMFTESLFITFTSMKNEIESSRASFEQSFQAEIARLSHDYQRTIKALRSDIIEDRLRVEKKLTTTRQTIESLASKVRIVEDAQSVVADMSSSNNLDRH